MCFEHFIYHKCLSFHTKMRKLMFARIVTCSSILKTNGIKQRKQWCLQGNSDTETKQFRQNASPNSPFLSQNLRGEFCLFCKDLTALLFGSLRFHILANIWILKLWNLILNCIPTFAQTLIFNLKILKFHVFADAYLQF